MKYLFTGYLIVAAPIFGQVFDGMTLFSPAGGGGGGGNFSSFLIDNDLNDINRNLLGPSQIAWIENAISKSNEKWTIFGQQVLMTKLKFPDISNALEGISDQLKPYIQLIKLGLPSNLDAWDGYPKERKVIQNYAKIWQEIY